MPNVLIEAGPNELLILENRHFACKIFTERTDRQPAKGNPRNHHAKFAQGNELFAALYVSDSAEPYDDTDDADQGLCQTPNCNRSPEIYCDEKFAGQRAAQGRAASSWAASRKSVASSPNRPTK